MKKGECSDCGKKDCNTYEVEHDKWVCLICHEKYEQTEVKRSCETCESEPKREGNIITDCPVRYDCRGHNQWGPKKSCEICCYYDDYNGHWSCNHPEIPRKEKASAFCIEKNHSHWIGKSCKVCGRRETINGNYCVMYLNLNQADHCIKNNFRLWITTKKTTSEPVDKDVTCAGTCLNCRESLITNPDACSGCQETIYHNWKPKDKEGETMKRYTRDEWFDNNMCHDCTNEDFGHCLVILSDDAEKERFAEGKCGYYKSEQEVQKSLGHNEAKGE